MVFDKLICVNYLATIKNPNCFLSKIKHVGDFKMFAQLYRGYHQPVCDFVLVH